MQITGVISDYVAVYSGGVVMSFTPCVYPLLPVMSAAVGGANVSGSRVSGFLLSLAYVSGMAVSYSLLAVLAALTGQIFGQAQNSFWSNFAVGNVLILFSLVMFDVIPLPGFGMSGAKVQGRGAWALFLMGLASGFVASPCTAPALGALLLYTASHKNVITGMSLLLTFSFGLGTSLLLAGTFSGFLTSLPRAGVWMDRVKKFAAVILLALGQYYILKAGQMW